MNLKKKDPITAAQVAIILNLYDNEDDFSPTGEYIAADLLSGKIAFTYTEVEAIATYYGTSIQDLAEEDKRFSTWIPDID